MAENNNNNNDNDGELPNNVRHTSSCAACKHQRRKCQKDCLLAPYFSYKQMQEFIAVHKLFGVSNVSKKLKNLDVQEQRDRVAESIKWEAMEWERDPMYGPLGLCERLSAKAEELTAQFEEQKNQIELLNKKIEQQMAQIELLKTQLEEQQRKNHRMMCLDDQETVGNGAARVVLSSGSTSTNHNNGDLEVHQIVPPETKILFNGSGPVACNDGTAHGVGTGTSSNQNDHEINLELSQMVPYETQIHHYNNNGTDHSQVASNWTTRGETSYHNGDMLPPSSSVNSHTQGVGRDHQGNGNGHMVNNVPTAPPHYPHHIQIQSQGMSFPPMMSRPLQAQDITRSNGQNNGGPWPWPYPSHVQQAHLLEIGSQQARGNNGDSYGMNFHQNGYGGGQRMGNGGTNGVANTSQDRRRSNGTGGRGSGIVNHSINGRGQNGGGLGSGVANPSINGRGQGGMPNHVGGVHTGVNLFDNHGVTVGHGRPPHTSAPNPNPQGQQSNQQDLGAVLGPPNWHYGNGGN